MTEVLSFCTPTLSAVGTAEENSEVPPPPSSKVAREDDESSWVHMTPCGPAVEDEEERVFALQQSIFELRARLHQHFFTLSKLLKETEQALVLGEWARVAIDEVEIK